MHLRFFFFSLLFAASILQPCDGQTPESPTPMPLAFDSPGIFPATKFLPAKSLTGKGYTIDPNVYNDGVYNTWRVSSDYGSYEVTGDERLTVCLREIAAIRAIRSQNNLARFGEGAAAAGKGTLQAAGNIVRNPVKTAQQLPAGALRFVGRVGQTVNHAATGTLDIPTDGDGAQIASKIVGVDKAKRNLAAKLGVNAFSSNIALQSALDDAAWSLCLGRLTVDIGKSLVLPVAAAATITAINVTSTLTREQIEASPSELVNSVKTQLAGLGAGVAGIDALTQNTQFNPWTLAAIANALAIVGPNAGIDAFVSRAATAANDLDAFYFVRTAQLMASYSTTSAITGIEPAAVAIVCRDASGKIVVPLWADYLLWTPELDQACQRVLAQAANLNAPGVVLYTTAKMSPAVASGFAAKGIQVTFAE